MGMVTVQVLVPCYNYGRYLEHCVQSVLIQPGVDVDVLIIDDCSQDNTAEVCNALKDRDNRVRVIRHEKNMGHIATYNEGIGLIQGDYFVLLSADDLLVEGALVRAVSLMEAHPAVGMTYGQAISFTNNKIPRPRTKSMGTKVWDGRRWMRHVYKSGKNFVICPEVVVRACIQRQIGGYDPALPHSGDLEMWLRIAAVSDVGYVRGTDQAYYRVHKFSMQNTVNAGYLFDLNGRMKAFQSALDKEGASLVEREELLRLAKRALTFSAMEHAFKLCDFPELDSVPPNEYRNFAASLSPDIVGTRRYLALQMAEMRQRRGLRKVVATYGARLRRCVETKIVFRAEWHWHRHTGLWFPRTF